MKKNVPQTDVALRKIAGLIGRVSRGQCAVSIANSDYKTHLLLKQTKNPHTKIRITSQSFIIVRKANQGNVFSCTLRDSVL